jgi:hypothetical protein
LNFENVESGSGIVSSGSVLLSISIGNLNMEAAPLFLTLMI